MKNKIEEKNVNILKLTFIILNICGFLYLFAILLLLLFETPVDSNSNKEVCYCFESIECNKDLISVSADLHDKGLTRSKYIFFIKAQIDGDYFKYPAGDYILSPNMTIDEIINVLKGETE